MGSSATAVGPPDRQTLRLLERHLADDRLIATTRFEPDVNTPRRLVAHLDATSYPASVTEARVDVRWFASGDFSFHYVESGADGRRWQCRWDRHPNDHNTRVHFHRPPDGSEVEDRSLPSLHPLAVYSTVLEAIAQRIDAQWSDEA